VAAYLFNRLVSGIRHQCHVAGDFDGVCHTTLVFVRQLGALRRLELELTRDEFTQECDVLVVDANQIVAVLDASLHTV